MRSVFVTGTDTGIGKSFVAAWATLSWNADYWKPVQSGTSEAWEEDLLRQVAPDATLHPSRHAFAAPLSPDQAARREGVRIALEDFTLPVTARPLVVEGAGGLLVPLNERHLMIDLIGRLGLPILLVARSTLGTINHSLLSIEALRARGLLPAGIVLVGPVMPENRAAIEHFGQVKVVAELPILAGPLELRTHPPLQWRPFDG